MTSLQYHSNIGHLVSQSISSPPVASDRNFILLPRRPLSCTGTAATQNVGFSTPMNGRRDKKSTPISSLRPRSLYKSRKRRVSPNDTESPSKDCMSLHTQRLTSGAQQQLKTFLSTPESGPRRERVLDKPRMGSFSLQDQDFLNDENLKENTPIRRQPRKVSVCSSTSPKLSTSNVTRKKSSTSSRSPMSPKRRPLASLQPVRTPERPSVVSREAFLPLTPSYYQQNSWQCLSPPPAARLHHASVSTQQGQHVTSSNDESILLQHIFDLSLGSGSMNSDRANCREKLVSTSKPAETRSTPRRTFVPSLNQRFGCNTKSFFHKPQEKTELSKTSIALAKRTQFQQEISPPPCAIISTSFESHERSYSTDKFDDDIVSGYDSSQSSLSDSSDELDHKNINEADFFLLNPFQSLSISSPIVTGKKQRKQDNCC